MNGKAGYPGLPLLVDVHCFGGLVVLVVLGVVVLGVGHVFAVFEQRRVLGKLL